MTCVVYSSVHCLDSWIRGTDFRQSQGTWEWLSLGKNFPCLLSFGVFLVSSFPNKARGRKYYCLSFLCSTRSTWAAWATNAYRKVLEIFPSGFDSVCVCQSRPGQDSIILWFIFLWEELMLNEVELSILNLRYQRAPNTTQIILCI